MSEIARKTATCRIYEETLEAYKDEQYRCRKARLPEPSHAELAEAAWNAYLRSQQPEHAILPSARRKFPSELETARDEELRALVPVLRLFREKERQLRQDPDPDAGPLELPRVKKR